jgi:Protein of unknown function (DUF2939)
MQEQSHRRARRRRWGLLAAAALCILLGLYLVSPLIALHSIASAVEARDAVALTERIEFPSLRRSLTKQIVEEYLKLTGRKLPLNAFGKGLAVSVADPIVARLMTVRALLDLLGKADAGEKAKLPLDRAPFTWASSESLWRLWLNAEYQGRSFYVLMPPDRSRSEQFKAHLQLIGWRWRIVGLGLPEDLKQHLAEELIKLTQDRLNLRRND